METTLPEPLVVKVTDEAGNPKEGVTINWGITRVPDGAQGAVLGSPETTTNEDGLAGAFLTLGDTEGDYQVTATCSGCNSGSSQVVFTAKAKCAIASDAIIPKDQCGSGVKGEKYDSTDNTICSKGCALTALTMLLNYYGVETDVLKLNDWLKANDGYDAGNVIWWKIKDYPGSTIKYRGSGNNNLLKEKLKNGNPVIIKTKRGDSDHFVVAFCKNGSTYKIWDPADGSTTTLENYGNKIQDLRFYGQ